ncbi:unnamed protein product [Diatraea saccharalis]|uniref:Uncharacterized protein n=1 Tax=Diatraea saccharalis TaxID=40085 RepID=A0A9N9R4C1_9NEOP|nr:unnamed protein product [Diatraea saccharalis]
MNKNDIQKLDEETLDKLTEGLGPTDECLCSLLSPPEGEKKGFRQSIKKAFASIGQGRSGRRSADQGSRRAPDKRPGLMNTIDVPLTFTKGAKGIYTTKENVKSNCGKCGCSNENIVLKHSYANIRITSPDISSICPCPSDCLPDKAKLSNNIKVTIERLAIDTPSDNTGPDSGNGSLDTISRSEHSASLYTEEI